jgi:glyoxylase-like metal-dependent hydrolase (beta-lactamase superfamily II)
MSVTVRLLAPVLWLGSAALLASGPLETSVARAREMLIREDLGDAIYAFRAPGELDHWTSTNSVVVVNDDDVVVFDSPTRAVTARAVIAEIQRLTPKPVRILINSHWHQDHWSGNDEYVKAYPGLRILATAETRDYMQRTGSAFFSAGSQRTIARLTKELETGKLADGSTLTAEARARKETSLAKVRQFADEVASVPRVLPDMVYREEMTFWSGAREFRLMSVTGDATASTVLYLPGSRVLVTGDVLVSPEKGNGPPPWTTNSYAIAPWLESLRRLEALESRAIVPGQGPTMRDEAYLRRTIALFAAIRDQVHSALERGIMRLEEVQAAVNVDAIGREYNPGLDVAGDFRGWVGTLVKKVMQEAQDGAADVNR